MIRKLSHGLMGVVGATVLATSTSWSPLAAASEPFIGQIQYFPYNFAPRSWAFCNGQLLPISQNTALFALIGTFYGGDGRTTVGLPDMRGRAPIHPGQGPGLSRYAIGQKGGVETVTLTSNQVPSHSHTLFGTNNLGDQASPAGGALARDGRDQTYRNEAPDTDLVADSIATSGGGQPHNNMPPYLALNCNIALTGLFPSRN
jgi:microcystin-dependent protein